jgi:hypothetical protein
MNLYPFKPIDPKSTIPESGNLKPLKPFRLSARVWIQTLCESLNSIHNKLQAFLKLLEFRIIGSASGNLKPLKPFSSSDDQRKNQPHQYGNFSSIMLGSITE